MLTSPLSSPLRSALASAFAVRRGGAPAFNPSTLFGTDLVAYYGASVDEVWKKQLSGGAVSLYQDSAGATPATALEQSIGRIVDISGNGYHLTQTTATSRMVLSARYNMLVGSDTLSTQSVPTEAAGYRLQFSGAGTVTLSGTATGTFSAGSHSITATAGTLTLTVSGAVSNADFRYSLLPSIFPSYQRVTTSTDYDAVGFPARLVADGVDDWYSAASVNINSDQATIFSTFQRNRNGSVDPFFSTQTASAGLASISTSAVTRVDLRDNTKGQSANIWGAGESKVQTCSYDTSQSLAANEVALRVNGSPLSLTFSGGPVATANIGTHAIEIGRWVASFYLKGSVFGIPMLVKRLATAGELAEAEKAFGKVIGVLQ